MNYKFNFYDIEINNYYLSNDFIAESVFSKKEGINIKLRHRKSNDGGPRMNADIQLEKLVELANMTNILAVSNNKNDDND